MYMNHDDQLDILTKYVEKMPTFSPATGKIIKLAHNMNSSPAEIVAAIRLDPVLTGRVLQLVNSAYFSLAQKVTSLNRAVVYLGINTIKNLALSTAVMETFNTKNKEVAVFVRPAWRHSLATAVCSKIIAKSAQIPPASQEEFFIAGLLHDLGRIILLQAFYSKEFENSWLSIEQEKKLYGFDHTKIGTDTLMKWKFPEELIAPVRAHHAPTAQDKIACFVHVADVMTYRLGLNDSSGERQNRPILPTALEVIGLSEGLITKDLASAGEQIKKAEIFLDIANSKEKVVERE